MRRHEATKISIFHIIYFVIIPHQFLPDRFLVPGNIMFNVHYSSQLLIRNDHKNCFYVLPSAHTGLKLSMRSPIVDYTPTGLNSCCVLFIYAVCLTLYNVFWPSMCAHTCFVTILLHNKKRDVWWMITTHSNEHFKVVSSSWKELLSSRELVPWMKCNLVNLTLK